MKKSITPWGITVTVLSSLSLLASSVLLAQTPKVVSVNQSSTIVWWGPLSEAGGEQPSSTQPEMVTFEMPFRYGNQDTGQVALVIRFSELPNSNVPRLVGVWGKIKETFKHMDVSGSFNDPSIIAEAIARHMDSIVASGAKRVIVRAPSIDPSVEFPIFIKSQS